MDYMKCADGIKKFNIIVAATASRQGIGREGTLPWRLQGDMKNFKSVTSNILEKNSDGCLKNAVIMGRKTWESLPKKFRPLSDRVNVVLSKNPDIRTSLDIPPEVLVLSSLDDALKCVSDKSFVSHGTAIDQVFVIGGEVLYTEAIKSKYCQRIFLTEVFPHDPSIEDTLDAFFPVVPASKFQLTSRSLKITEGEYSYRYLEYQSIDGEEEIAPKLASVDSSSVIQNLPVGNIEEIQYLNIINDILATGVQRGDRTGTGTISKFGVQMRFSLRDGRFPLLTTKKVFWRGVAEELLWFVKGSTNAGLLKEKGIHIWDGNGSREFLDKLGLHNREEGDLGPVYGFQWRHFGAQYRDMHADYTGEGIDQLQECINKIKNTPEDRRIIMTAWNPADLSKMALPPCHMFCQFYVANGELSCQMYQRSADMGLGVPFNIASYSLLTVMMAQVCGLQPGDFVHSIGDAHIYSNHVDALKKQITRDPRDFPTLKINPSVKDIDAFKFDDFKLENYQPYEAIPMKMAV